ncbi:hypothetical protein B0H16DRAFT_1748215 [Mycena metata]|uniref:Uncharacterized protein n=1 Tax=Mycena metata TaxID=1033252 RepID=A0AAD7GQX8_9AGAR|nr:hypothetical protein B0H16DRAFT_1748215 [Mycena metata]
MRRHLTGPKAGALVTYRPTGIRTRIPANIMPPLDSPSLEPHIEFDFFHRVHTEVTLRDPEQPFPKDLLPDEDLDASAALPTTSPLPTPPSGRVRTLFVQQRMRDAAKRAAIREERYRCFQALAARDRAVIEAGSPRAAIHVAEGGAVDPSLIEDRDYDLDEVVGSESKFRLRLIPWGGAMPRAVVDEKRVVVVLGGRARNGDWKNQIIDPATEVCDVAKESMHQSPEDIAAGKPKILSGGVGDDFNSWVPTAERRPYASILNALIFFQMFTGLAMLHLVGYGNRLLQMFVPDAFNLLSIEKNAFLQHDSSALYPCSSSVFSTATVEFGPHLQSTNRRHQAASWSILVALGKYVPRLGGHIILWDLGLVIAFPPGSCILIPTGLIRYSFVKARNTLLLGSVGGGGYWADQHRAREGQRELDQDAAVAAFPHEDDLPLESIQLSFYGTQPDAETIATVY